jgi:uncharacterized protein YecE (DUF72 family)
MGLPAWAYPDWEGKYFSAGEPKLPQYAQVFNCVEGNTTFYSIPSVQTVSLWREQLSGTDFQFCFKLPREVTHDGNHRSLSTFLQRLEPVVDHLGPFLVQLPASVGPQEVSWIKGLLGKLPEHAEYALEVRHPDFYKQADTFHQLLADSGCYRVVMDARPIHDADPDHPDIQSAQHAKPNLPVYAEPCNGGILVRLVLHPDDALNDAYYAQWTRLTSGWLASGIRVWMMIHCANNFYSPSQARRFHQGLQVSCDLPDLASWPLAQGSLF